MAIQFYENYLKLWTACTDAYIFPTVKPDAWLDRTQIFPSMYFCYLLDTECPVRMLENYMIATDYCE